MQPLTNNRCAWARGDTLMEAYHDEEWGRSERDGRALFEKLQLDGLQAGLSWRTILHRRAGLRQALDGFAPEIMAHYGSARLTQLLVDPRLIRNRAKVAALVSNARAYLALVEAGEHFGAFLWDFVGGSPQQHQRPAGALAPTQSPESEAMAKALKKRGFTFCGPTICYAFMQATGMVNDHDRACSAYAACGGGAP